MIIPKQEFMFKSIDGSAQELSQEFDMSSQVTSATAVIEGMDILFSGQVDHHLGRLRVFLTTDVIGANTNRVIVTGFFALRDWSGGDHDFNGDDPFEGTVHYSVFIDV